MLSYETRAKPLEKKTNKNARKEIYTGKGYALFEKFISQDLAHTILSRWLNKKTYYYFDHFHKNTEVTLKTPNYLAKRPTEEDISLCFNSWRPPLDDQLSEIASYAQQVRNQIEERPLFFGTRHFDDLLLQYRLCRSLSPGTIVWPHSDFFDEPRKDATGSHEFDPRRTQMTLFLSSYGKDYDSGGFFFEDNSEKEILFGRDIKAEAGDLLIWKYSNKHWVENIRAKNKKGFSRIVFPLFDQKQMGRTE